MTSEKIPATLTLPAILLAALILRLWGVNFGLPHLYHADEPIIINQAMSYGAGSLKPVYFKIPQFVSLLVFVCYGIYYLVLHVLGIVQTPESFGRLFLIDPSSFYLLARIVFGVLLGVLSVFLLYRIAKRIGTRRHGLIAGFLLATAFLHVRDSHYIYMDIPLLCLLVVSFEWIDNIVVRGWKRDYAFMGVLTGLAVAAKYNGVFIGVPFLTAHAMNVFRTREIKKHFYPLMTGSLALLTFALANPTSLIFMRDFAHDMTQISTFEGYIGWTHHLFYSLTGAVGLPLLLAAGFGLGLSFFRREARFFPMAFFVLAYYVVLCVCSQEHDRYVLPLIPFLCFFAAHGVLTLSGTGVRKNLYLTVLLSVCVLPSLVKTVLCNQLLARKDVRTLALEWTQAQIPGGSKIALDVPFFMPRLKPTLEQLAEKEREIRLTGRKADLKRVQWLEEAAARDPVPRYQLYFMDEDLNGFMFSKPRIHYDMGELRSRGIEYVMMTKMSGNHQTAFYEELKSRAQLIMRFSPYKNPFIDRPISRIALTAAPFLWRELIARERNGQVIEIFRLNRAA